MARPILKVKNTDSVKRRYTVLAKKGRKRIRAEFGIPFPLQSIIAAEPKAKSAILGTLHNGDRFDGQKLVRLLARINRITVDDVVANVKEAKL